MGLILTKLWRFFVYKDHKICLVGLDNAGKTTILYQFLINEVVHTSTTVGSNVEEVVWNNIHFVMWDLGGQEAHRSAWNTYYSNTEFIILVVDSADRERLSIVKQELHRLLESGDLSKASILVFANKQDLAGCLSSSDISVQLNLQNVRKHKWQIQPCSAYTGEGLYQGLEWIASNINKR